MAGAFSFPKISLGFLSAAAIMLISTLKSRLSDIFYGMIAMMTCIWLTFVFAVYPSMNFKKSAREFSRTINKEWSPGEHVFYYKYYRPQLHLYSDFFLEDISDKKLESISKLFQGSERVFLLFRKEDTNTIIAPLIHTRFYILWDKDIDNCCVVLITNKPPRVKKYYDNILYMKSRYRGIA